MDKDLFFNVYKNKVLNNQINNDIRYIHKQLYLNSRKLNWKEISQSPILLSEYGYYDHFKLLSANLNTLNIRDCGMASARYGHLNILKFIIDNYKSAYDPNIIELFFKSALHGANLQIIEYIYSLKEWDLTKNRLFFQAVAHSGSIEVCEWYVNRFKVNSLWCEPYDLYCYATYYGNLDVLKWTIQFFKHDSSNYISNLDLWVNAIDSKNNELLDFMYNHVQFKNTFKLKRCLLHIIRTSNIELLDWIFSKEDSASFGDSEVFKALIHRSNIRMIELCSDRLGYRIETLNNRAQWFYKRCKHYRFNAIDYAIKFNKSKIILWFYQNTNFQGTSNPLQDFDETLDLLEWFTENNRPERIPLSTLSVLGSNKRHLPIVEYIIKYRTEHFPNFQKILEFILLKSESIEFADILLIKNPVTITNNIIDSKTIERIIKANKIETVKWIHKNTTIGFTEDGIRSAYFLFESTMIEWLHKNRTESCYSDSIKMKFHCFSTSIKSFIINNQPDMIPSNVLEQLNDFSLSKFIIDHYPTKYIHNDSLFAVSKSGNVEIVKYLHEYYKKHDINHETNHFDMNSFYLSLDLSIKNQYTDIVNYLRENSPVNSNSQTFK